MPSIDDQDAGARRSEGTATPAVPSRSLLWWPTFGYSVFVIYGSLVPLQFHARPLREAWEYFERIPYLDLGIGSRADWVANILLFVPLAFLWHGVLWPNRGRIAKAVASGFVLLGCLALSVAIEFTQIFFPPRTVSLNDIVAETIGAVIGTVLWWWTGKHVIGWLAGWSKAYTPTGTTERFLYLYLFLLFGYSLLPLDLTISVVEIYHKWHEGKILLVPFSAVYETGAQRAYALLADIAIWIPAAFLWKLSSHHPARKIVLSVVACAAIIEFLQLFVYSRVTSTTDVLMAACGGAIGVALARWLRPATGKEESSRSPAIGGDHFVLPWMLALLGWACVLVVVFWYPFDFNTEWGFVHRRLAAFKRVPFETYYFGTEFRAVTEVFHKTGFFFPLGALLAVGAYRIRRRFAVPALLLHAVSALVIACAAAGIEVGQLFLPSKVADTTDWLLETLGGLIGYFCLQMLMPLWQSGRRNTMPQQAPGRQR
jgi:glycopeptide antibiotics resistance protein